MTKTVTTRDGRLDSLKGFLILLVVIGHIIGESGITESGAHSIAWGGVRIWIYIFHMPLFVLLSGYFTRRNNSSVELVHSLKGLASSLIVFQIISLVFLYVIKHEFSALYLVTPYWTLWYLLSLVFWRIILYYTPNRLLQNPILYLIIASLVSILSGLILPYGRILSIQRTLSFYPFFLLGYYMGNARIVVPINKTTRIASLLIIVCLSCVVFGGALPSYSGKLLLGAYRYPINQLLTKLVLFLFSILMSLSFYIVFKENSVLAKIGRDSLFYYLYHGILIQFILIPILTHWGVTWNTVTVTISFLFIMLTLWLMSKSKALLKLTNPLR